MLVPRAVVSRLLHASPLLRSNNLRRASERHECQWRSYTFSVPEGQLSLELSSQWYFQQMDSNNSSSQKATYADEDIKEYERFALIRAGVLGLVFLFAACGNFFFLYTLWKKRKKCTKTQLFLLHLCLADLVVAFFQVLPQLSMEITHRFKGTDFVCRSVKYLQVVGMFASAYMIVAMTIDRYHAVCKPMMSFFKGSLKRHLSIGAAWLISLAFSAPQLFIFSLQEVEEKQFDCWATFIEPWGRRIYISWITLSVFALPAVILLFCQMRICTTIYLNMKKKALQARPLRAGPKGVSNAMLKTVKMTFVIIMAYTVCWSPFFIVQLWSAWSPSTAPTNGPIFVIIMLLAGLNSCTNPWIYIYYS